MTTAGIRHGFNSVLEKIGIDATIRKTRNLVFHGLRHTFVTLSRASGVRRLDVQAMAGHRSGDMTDDYTDSTRVVDYKSAREALEKSVNF